MRADHCHHCHYDLTGLPAQGRCPECGKLYNTQSFYREKTRSEEPIARYMQSIVLGAVALVILLFGSTLSLMVDSAMLAFVLTLICAAVPAFGAFVYWRAERAERRNSG